MIYLEVLSLAVALFILLRFVSSYFPVLTGSRKIRKIFLKIFPMVEMLAWLAYVFWAIDHLQLGIAAYRLLTGSLIVVIVILLGWYFLRDFISGIILKSENSFEPGQLIHTAEVSGTIRKLGYRTMEIVTGEGVNVKIPFSLLSGQNIVKPADTGNWVEQLIRLQITSDDKPEQIQRLLKNRILEMPWIVSGEHIKIKITRDESGKYIAEIAIRSMNSEMAMKTEETLRVFANEVFG
ncbi:MAG TPA: mechanosensitive ion channel domain-containing protein [Prolixibacteraceae bacterium]|nr:mechanosensitive ion channel domain-containing protein [Prolixibacteraceae bacterium]